MGGKSKGSNSEAAQARADEQERQARIRAGTARVNSIFDGGKTVASQFGADAAYDPSKTYFKQDGSVWTPTIKPPQAASADTATLGIRGNADGSGDGNVALMSGGSSPPAAGAIGNTGGAPLTQEEEFRQALGGGLYGEVKDGKGFNDAFYNERRQAFLDYATPQLDEQYGEANKQLTYSLARSGLLDSSVRADKSAELQKKYDLNRQQIADQALSYETEARTNVEKARSDLVTMLNATGDAEGAASSALARSQALSAPQAFSPLTQLFADFTGGLAQQANYEKNAAVGGPGGRYNTGLFSNTKSVQNKN